MSDDPRAKLGGGGQKAVGGRFAGAEYVRPREKNWYGRGQNFIVGYTEAVAGTVLERDGQIDEYMVLIPEKNVGVTIEAGVGEQQTGAGKQQAEAEMQQAGAQKKLVGAEKRQVAGHSLVIVPPGKSRITVHAPGIVVRVFSARAEDLAAACVNAGSYAEHHPNIPPYEAWPAPTDGYRIRVYDLDVPPVKGRFGRIWRCSSVMVNVLPLEPGPRDLHRLSPHHHDDFEQGSLALQGSFTHHIRWPWTPDFHEWRADDHEVCPAPSLCVIPPPAIHTSAGSDTRMNQLVDVFAPPRMDFSKMDGWVLNAAEYPMPGEK